MDEFDQYEEQPKTGKDLFISLLPLIVVVGFWYFFHGHLGYITWDKTVMIISGAAFLWVGGKSMMASFKNASPKVIANPVYNTTDGEPVRIGNYTVFALGSVKAFGFYFKGREGTLTVPIDAVNRIGPSYACVSRVEKVSIKELPRDVRNFVIQNGLQPPYWFGFADEDQLLSKPELSTLTAELKASNEQITKLEGRWDSVIRMDEKAIAADARMKERAKGTPFDKMFESDDE